MKLYELTQRKEFDYQRRKKAQAVSTYIRKYCRPWISATAGNPTPVYRGYADLNKYSGYREPGRNDPLYFTHSVRTDREPRNTSTDTHHQINQALADCGAVANRSNAVFVTGNKTMASYYGTVYVIYPVGPFHFTWSEKWDDWYEWAPLVQYEWDWNILQTIEAGTFCDEIRHDDSITDAIRRGNEIMISCQKYLALQPDFANLVNFAGEWQGK